MGGIAAWARTGSRWTRGGLAVFVGLAGAAGIFSVAAWSRTREALPAFERFAPAADAAVSDDVPSAADAPVLEQIVHAAGATSWLMIADVPATFYRPDDGTAVTIGAATPPVPAAGPLDRGHLVAGRPPDPSRSDELMVNEAAAADLHVHAGSKIDVGLFSASQRGGSGTGEPTPQAARVPMTVTGIVRYTADLEHQPNAQAGTEFATAGERVSFGDGFWPVYSPVVAIDFLGVAVKLPDGRAGFGRLASTTADLSDGRFTSSLGDNFIPNRAALVRTIDLQAAALLAAGLLGALVGAVLVAQAIGRQVAFRAADHHVLASLGMTPPQIVTSEVLAAVPVAIGGALTAVLVAVALSPLSPVGVARDADLQPGVHVDWLVVVVGGAVVALFTLLVTAIAARAGGRRPVATAGRRPWFAARLAAAGAPPSVVAGSDFALSRQGRTSGAVRPALAALVVGIAVVVGASVVQSSLSKLLRTPAERGWAWDAQVGLLTSADQAKDAAGTLDEDPDVAGYDGQLGGVYVPIDGRPTPITVLDPHGAVAGPVVLDGRAASAPDEIALGPQTLADLHKHVGDFVDVTSPEDQVLRVRVVGTVIPVSAVDPLESFGDGAIVPFVTAQRTAGPDQPLIPSAYLVTLRRGVDRGAALARLRQLFPGTVLVAPVSADVDTLRRVDWLPLALAALVALLTIATLGQLIVGSVRRRRPDLAVLRALGSTNGQIAGVVVSIAIVLAGLALLVGVPAGLAAGRVAWTIIASGLGTEAGPGPRLWVLTIIPAALVVAILAALVPAWRVVRRDPAGDLRRE